MKKVLVFLCIFVFMFSSFVFAEDYSFSDFQYWMLYQDGNYYCSNSPFYISSVQSVNSQLKCNDSYVFDSNKDYVKHYSYKYLNIRNIVSSNFPIYIDDTDFVWFDGSAYVDFYADLFPYYLDLEGGISLGSLLPIENCEGYPRNTGTIYRFDNDSFIKGSFSGSGFSNLLFSDNPIVFSNHDVKYYRTDEIFFLKQVLPARMARVKILPKVVGGQISVVLPTCLMVFGILSLIGLAVFLKFW